MKSIQNFFQDKKTRYGGYAALITIVVLTGLVLLNLMVQQLPAQLDLTKNRLFSLSAQSKKLLESLEQPVTIYALYAAGKEEPNIAEILRKYQQASPMVNLEFVDPDLNPGFVAKYDPDDKGIATGSLIVESGDLNRIIPNMDLFNISYTQQGQPQVMGLQVESKVTQAINYVSSGYTPKLYQLTGHQEFKINDYGIGSALEAENYELADLNLLTSPAVPDDAAVLLILSPKAPISDEELGKIHEYIDNGGRAVLLTDFIGDPSSGAGAILKSYGLEIEPGILMESDKSRYVNSPLLLAPMLQDHEITAPLKENDFNVVTPNSVSLKQLDRKPRAIELTPLLTTSGKSWRRTDINENSPLRQEGDFAGPFTIAWAVERKHYNDGDPEAFRLVAMGDSVFLGNIPPYGKLKGNVDFFLNAIAWTNERSETISIRSKSLFRLPMRLNALQTYIYAGIIVILIPAGFLIAGLAVWLKRRHL